MGLILIPLSYNILNVSLALWPIAKIRFSQGLKPQITYVLENATGMKMLREVEEFLKSINDLKEIEQKERKENANNNK